MILLTKIGFEKNHISFRYLFFPNVEDASLLMQQCYFLIIFSSTGIIKIVKS